MEVLIWRLISEKNLHLKKVEEAIQNVTKKCIHQKKFGFAFSSSFWPFLVM